MTDFSQGYHDDDAPIFEPVASVDWQETLKNNAPGLTFAAGNLLLMAAEYRVFAYAYDNTGEIWRGVFAVLSSYLPFLLWEIAVQHKKANGIMRGIAWVGIAISLSLSVVIGTAEFITLPGEAAANAEWLLGSLAVSLSVHAVLFLAYYYAHPDMRAKRLMAAAEGRQEIARLNAEIADSVLTSWRERLSMERAIAAEYGPENLRRVLDELEGVKHRQVGKKRAAWWEKKQAPAAQEVAAPSPLADDSLPAQGASLFAPYVAPSPSVSPRGHQNP